jgi:hypothetical protein
MKRITHVSIMAIILVALIVPLSSTTALAQPPCTPVMYISSVTMDQSVTIQAYHFPANLALQVLMGPYGSAGMGGTVVATVSSDSNGNVQGTYTIPSGLAGSQRIAIRLQATNGVAFAYNWFWNNTATSSNAPGYYGFPIITIASVNVDSSMTMSVSNLPANTDFVVLMGPYGSYGINGTQVGSFNSGSGGTESLTYNIPSGLKGSAQIAVRVQTNANDQYGYNWFWNNTSSSTTTTYPSVTVTGVVVNSTVSLHGYNFPADHTFNLYMGSYVGYTTGGTQVTSFTTGSGGEWTATFSIPSGLSGLPQIGIRLVSTTDNYVVTNWFWNNTTGTQPNPCPPAPSPVPNINISSVIQNSTVTVSAKNFPANTDFVVLMGSYGSYGVGGTQVASFNSGSGGTFSATYSIPSSASGMNRVAIRIQSASTGYYYAYNWFWNYTAN